MTILVTGATGSVGGQVAAQLAGRGHHVRVLTRNPATAPSGLAASGAEVVAGAPGEPDTLDGALDGVDTVFLVFPSVAADAGAAGLVGRLAAGVRRVVYLSAHGVPDEPRRTDPDGTILASHSHLEGLLADSDLEWTFLRPGGFASNTLGWADQIRRGDVVRWYVPGATRALIHEADIAAVGVRALTEDGWHGARPHLTGPEQLTQVEELDRVGAALGRPLRFSEIDADAVHAEIHPGAPRSMIDAIVAAHHDFAAHPELITDEVARLTGRPARTYAEWARDHVADFGGVPATR